MGPNQMNIKVVDQQLHSIFKFLGNLFKFFFQHRSWAN